MARSGGAVARTPEDRAAPITGCAREKSSYRPVGVVGRFDQYLARTSVELAPADRQAVAERQLPIEPHRRSRFDRRKALSESAKPRFAANGEQQVEICLVRDIVQ